MHVDTSIMCFHYGEEIRMLLFCIFQHDQMPSCFIVCCHFIQQTILRNVQNNGFVLLLSPYISKVSFFSLLYQTARHKC